VVLSRLAAATVVAAAREISLRLPDVLRASVFSRFNPARRRVMRSARFVLRFSVVAVVAGSLAMAALPASAAKKAPTVTVVKIDGLGKVLADANGKTLYTLTANGAPVACTGGCLAAWPPLIASGKPKGVKGVKNLGVDSATGQVTVDELPVYLFVRDTASGQANGQGINSFGGVWNVVKVTASSNKAKSSN
jgi:predicted lipoprotein with Yx(FWY)xxD motif